MSDNFKETVHKCLGSATAIQSGLAVVVHSIGVDKKECNETLDETLKRIESLKKEVEHLKLKINVDFEV